MVEESIPSQAGGGICHVRQKKNAFGDDPEPGSIWLPALHVSRVVSSDTSIF